MRNSFARNFGFSRFEKMKFDERLSKQEEQEAVRRAEEIADLEANKAALLREYQELVRQEEAQEAQEAQNDKPWPKENELTIPNEGGNMYTNLDGTVYLGEVTNGTYTIIGGDTTAGGEYQTGGVIWPPSGGETLTVPMPTPPSSYDFSVVTEKDMEIIALKVRVQDLERQLQKMVMLQLLPEIQQEEQPKVSRKFRRVN